MNTGAIVMLDALGFKGIWDRYPPLAVLDKMRMLRDDAKALSSRNLLGLAENVKHGVEALSDTFVTWAFVSDLPERDRDNSITTSLSLAVASWVAAFIMLRAASEHEPHLCFRGCATVGEFAIEETTLLGPAIDEAATEHVKAQAALTWLTPRARDLWRLARSHRGLQPQAKSVAQRLFVNDYHVPFRCGDTFRTSVISPFGGPEVDDKAVEAFKRNVAAAFNNQALDVQIKLQHTESFLSVAESTWRKHSADSNASQAS